MKRLFAAIKIIPDENFIQLFEELKSSLKHEKIKWVESNNLHLTLKFFGETEEKRIPQIIHAIDTSISGVQKFDFTIKDVGIFGSRYDPKVIWAGLKNEKALSSLAELLINTLGHIGYMKDRQNFVPHLTLGRIKYLKDKNLFQEIIAEFKDEYFQEVSVKNFYLYESTLTQNGPVYSVVRKFNLKA